MRNIAEVIKTAEEFKIARKRESDGCSGLRETEVVRREVELFVDDARRSHAACSVLT